MSRDEDFMYQLYRGDLLTLLHFLYKSKLMPRLIGAKQISDYSYQLTVEDSDGTLSNVLVNDDGKSVFLDNKFQYEYASPIDLITFVNRVNLKWSAEQVAYYNDENHYLGLKVLCKYRLSAENVLMTNGGISWAIVNFCNSALLYAQIADQKFARR